MQRLIDITGEKRNRLTVLGFDHMGQRRRSFWKCQCDCGKIVVLRKDAFYYDYSHVKSCGCWHSEVSRMKAKDKKGKYIKKEGGN